MEELLKQLLESVNEVKEEVRAIDRSVSHLEQRLARIEKVDSIEHYVSVNQIDISDVKEIVEEIKNFQREELAIVSEFIKNNMKGGLQKDIHHLQNRLDAQLLKIAQNEEAILMMTNKRDCNQN